MRSSSTGNLFQESQPRNRPSLADIHDLALLLDPVRFDPIRLWFLFTEPSAFDRGLEGAECFVGVFTQPGLGGVFDLDVEAVAAAVSALEEFHQLAADFFASLVWYDSEADGGACGARDNGGVAGAGDFDAVDGEGGVAPFRHQFASGGDVGEGLVHASFFGGDGADGNVKVRDGDDVVLRCEGCEEGDEVVCGFAVEAGAVDARVKVLTVRGDGDCGLNDAAEAVGEGGGFVVEPVGVCGEDPVDVPEEG